MYIKSNNKINYDIYKDIVGFEDYKKELKEIFNVTITNETFNDGFLEINTTHKGNYTYYDYTTNIIIYKDLYDNISYTPITENNTILHTNQISKEDFSKICEEGVLLDTTKYKRNKEPKISVVIPYFNKGNISITMCLRSIQNQSFKDIEIIFVDDGSVEEKIKDILNIMKDDNRIILLRHKERKSTLLTRVDGVRHSSGQYIIQIDQDDMYLNNLLFEQLYNKSKELHVDIIQFNFYSNNKPKIFKKEIINIPKNVTIKQPELRTTFLKKSGISNRLYDCSTRMIWNLFVKRVTYLFAIKDLGDEYMNHKFRYYEDTIMMFELSQVSYSYFFYDIDGIRHCLFNSGKCVDRNRTIEHQTLVKNQLLFLKLLLYKVDPKFDRYHIYKELNFMGSCGNTFRHGNRNDFPLGLQVVEAIFELERKYNNTAKELITCVNKIKKFFET